MPSGDGIPGYADAVPVAPEGISWNPVLGENRMGEGEGLNPRQTETTGPSPRPHRTNPTAGLTGDGDA
jgi:hypothetical protein